MPATRHLEKEHLIISWTLVLAQDVLSTKGRKLNVRSGCFRLLCLTVSCKRRLWGRKGRGPGRGAMGARWTRSCSNSCKAFSETVSEKRDLRLRNHHILCLSLRESRAVAKNAWFLGYTPIRGSNCWWLSRVGVCLFAACLLFAPTSHTVISGASYQKIYLLRVLSRFMI